MHIRLSTRKSLRGINCNIMHRQWAWQPIHNPPIQTPIDVRSVVMMSSRRGYENASLSAAPSARMDLSYGKVPGCSRNSKPGLTFSRLYQLHLMDIVCQKGLPIRFLGEMAYRCQYPRARSMLSIGHRCHLHCTCRLSPPLTRPLAQVAGMRPRRLVTTTQPYPQSWTGGTGTE
jgi:hypothetical protein